MIELIEEIRFCIKHDKLRSALGMALTLPDICGNIEFKGQNIKVEKRYVGWCDRYLFNEGHITAIIGSSHEGGEFGKQRVIDPMYCYKLRCAYLHSGNAILNQREKDDFPEFELRISSSEVNGVYTEPYTTCNDKVKEITVDVRHLCSVLCDTAEKYFYQHNKRDFIEHSFRIVDVEKNAVAWRQCKIKAEDIMMRKKNPSDYNELSESAKVLLKRIREDSSELNFPENLDSVSDREKAISILELLKSNMIQIDMPCNKSET